MKPIHQARHNRSMPMPKEYNNHKIDGFYLYQFKLLIESTPITLKIRKKKFKLWI